MRFHSLFTFRIYLPPSFKTPFTSFSFYVYSKTYFLRKQSLLCLQLHLVSKNPNVSSAPEAFNYYDSDIHLQIRGAQNRLENIYNIENTVKKNYNRQVFTYRAYAINKSRARGLACIVPKNSRAGLCINKEICLEWIK